MNITIQNSTREDLDLIFSLFDQSIIYQRQKGYPVWDNYDQGAIVRDVEEGNQYNVIVDGKVAMAFSVCYSDKMIWGERDKDDAVYLHRIVVNPEFKGQRLFGAILDWAVDVARKRNLKFVRMDTWASNKNIVAYYMGFGFTVVGNTTTPDAETLPVHSRSLAVTLLEYEVV